MKVLIVCVEGMSASILRRRITQALESEKKNWKITSQSYSNLSFLADENDIILFAPQLANMYDSCTQEYDGTGKVFALLTAQQYACTSGEEIIEFCEQLYNYKFQNGMYIYDDEVTRIIDDASKAQQLAYDAMDEISKNHFSKAKKFVLEGREHTKAAHIIQSRLIALQLDDSKKHLETTMLMVHAQDYLMNATTLLTLCEKMMKIFDK